MEIFVVAPFWTPPKHHFGAHSLQPWLAKPLSIFFTTPVSRVVSIRRRESSSDIPVRRRGFYARRIASSRDKLLEILSTRRIIAQSIWKVSTVFSPVFTTQSNLAYNCHSFGR
jgi:hypothetical protein